MKHSYQVTPELFMFALAIVTGAAAGRENVSCYVVEQGGSSIPCVIFDWFETNHFGNKIPGTSIAFPVGEMLRFLDLPLPYRGERA